MKNRIVLFAFVLVSFAFSSRPSSALQQKPSTKKANFEIGYNEAWFGNDYLYSMIKTFDINYVNKVFADIKSSGGDIVRMYLFQVRQGLVINQFAPQTAGIDPVMFANIKSMLDSARAHGLRVYFTLHDADAMPAPPQSELRDYYFNLIHNKFGEADAFNANVMTPLLNLLSQYQDTVYGIDLANELSAAIKNQYWGLFDQFDGPRRWLKSMRDFIRTQAPWIRVSCSAMNTADVEGGLYSDLGLDFYDVHIYNDKGEIPYFYELCDIVHKTGIPIIVGEFGQLGQNVDDALQSSVTLNLLNNAKNQCFSGAIAWRFDPADVVYHYQRSDGTLRPAVDVIKAFKAGL